LFLAGQAFAAKDNIIEVILDCSGSRKDSLSSGQTGIETASEVR
jgi:hypothetical protein